LAVTELSTERNSRIMERGSVAQCQKFTSAPYHSLTVSLSLSLSLSVALADTQDPTGSLSSINTHTYTDRATSATRPGNQGHCFH